MNLFSYILQPAYENIGVVDSEYIIHQVVPSLGNQVSLYVHIHTYLPTYIHTYVHTCMHTYIIHHTCMQNFFSLIFLFFLYMFIKTFGSIHLCTCRTSYFHFNLNFLFSLSVLSVEIVMPTHLYTELHVSTSIYLIIFMFICVEVYLNNALFLPFFSFLVLLVRGSQSMEGPHGKG
jgi:hypothetical protein